MSGSRPSPSPGPDVPIATRPDSPTDQVRPPERLDQAGETAVGGAAVPTTLPSPPVAAAREVLAAVALGDLPFEVSMAVAEADIALSDVHPPLPPVPHPEGMVDAEAGIAQAVALLAAAVQDAPTGEEALRAALASRVLKDVQSLPHGDEVDLLQAAPVALRADQPVPPTARSTRPLRSTAGTAARSTASSSPSSRP